MSCKAEGGVAHAAEATVGGLPDCCLGLHVQEGKLPSCHSNQHWLLWHLASLPSWQPCCVVFPFWKPGLHPQNCLLVEMKSLRCIKVPQQSHISGLLAGAWPASQDNDLCSCKQQRGRPCTAASVHEPHHCQLVKCAVMLLPMPTTQRLPAST